MHLVIAVEPRPVLTHLELGFASVFALRRGHGFAQVDSNMSPSLHYLSELILTFAPTKFWGPLFISQSQTFYVLRMSPSCNYVACNLLWFLFIYQCAFTSIHGSAQWFFSLLFFICEWYLYMPLPAQRSEDVNFLPLATVLLTESGARLKASKSQKS